MGSKVVKKSKPFRQSISASDLKKPKLAGPPSIDGRYLAWRFSNADLEGPFSWGQISDADRQTVWNRLREFEKMTVNELKSAGSHHSVSQQNMSRNAKDRLRELQMDDLEELHSFRIDGKARLWCIKHENIYAVLWWDPEHKVYPVSKKHT